MVCFCPLYTLFVIVDNASMVYYNTGRLFVTCNLVLDDLKYTTYSAIWSTHLGTANLQIDHVISLFLKLYDNRKLSVCLEVIILYII